MIGGLGRDYDLAPRAAIGIRVVIAGFDTVPPGATARTWPDLGLKTAPTTLTVLGE
jgi:hypothetical protein